MKQVQLPQAMAACPTVFLLDGVYKIYIPFTCQALVKIRVGDTEYYDDSNGILRSGKPLHSVEIPQDALDEARAYTVCFRVIIERKPYFPTSEEWVELTFSFRPIPAEGPIRIYHIADAHNMEAPVIRVGQYFGDDLDLLILNGDVINHSGAIENFNTVYTIASAITGGSRAVIFSRGNHDTRGYFAEEFCNYTPMSTAGKPYFTFRAGPIWAIVLDCGEDKPDTNEEYGHTVCFHPYRLKETEFIKQVIAHAEEEYLAEGVRHRLLISHVPFAYINKPPFDIEQELYGEWCRLMREEIRPELAIHGHTHRAEIWAVGRENDHLGQACPAVIGSKPENYKQGQGEQHFTGCGIVLDGEKTTVIFNDDQGNVDIQEI